MSHDAGRVCHCAAVHRPAPLELNAHHVWPQGFGGPTIPANLVFLCPSGHVNVHELLRLFLRDHRVWTYREASDIYDVPVSRYAYRVAAVGFRAVTTRTVLPVEEP